jgi:hypothetical protein
MRAGHVLALFDSAAVAVKKVAAAMAAVSVFDSHISSFSSLSQCNLLQKLKKLPLQRLILAVVHPLLAENFWRYWRKWVEGLPPPRLPKAISL